MIRIFDLISDFSNETRPKFTFYTRNVSLKRLLFDNLRYSNCENL